MAIQKNYRRGGSSRIRTAAPLTRRIVVATDGRPPAEPAVRAAALLEREHRGHVDAVAVVESLSIAIPDAGMFDVEPAELELFGNSEMVLQVARLAHEPVLAASPELDHLPRRALVAVDFSRASLEAVRAVLQLVPRTGTVHLAHVRPIGQGRAPSDEEWDTFYESGVTRMFEDLRREVRMPRVARTETLLLDGEIAPTLLALAHDEDVDLLAVGVHHHAVEERVLLGSITARLVRGSTRSVLVAPPAAVPARRYADVVTSRAPVARRATRQNR